MVPIAVEEIGRFVRDIQVLALLQIWLPLAIVQIGQFSLV